MITVAGENIMLKGCFSEPKGKYLTFVGTVLGTIKKSHRLMGFFFFY